jgi:hypothetical protein
VRVIFFLLACGYGPQMSPGDDCQPCHKRFTVSGTIFAHPDSLESEGIAGARVVVTDADQKSIAMDTNAAGNFYTEERLRFPVMVEVQRGVSVRRMGPLVEKGGCNSCHTLPPSGGAAGRIGSP